MAGVGWGGVGGGFFFPDPRVGGAAVTKMARFFLGGGGECMGEWESQERD